MLIFRLHSIDDATAFCAFLRGAHVDAASDGDLRVQATVPGAQSPLHERRELTGYVATWNALNPGRQAEIVD